MTGSGATRVLLVGGSSEIGLATVRRLRRDGPVSAVLLGRDPRGWTPPRRRWRDGVTPVATEVVDADALAEHEQAVANAFAASDGFDVALIAIGRLGAQSGLDAAAAEVGEVMQVSFVGAGSLLITACAGCARRGPARWSSCPRWPPSARARPTPCTAPPRRGLMRSPRGSPTPRRVPACGCWSCVRAS